MATAAELAEQRDRLRHDQVRDRGDIRDLRTGLAKRGRHIKHLGRRITNLRRQDAHLSAKGRDFLISVEGIVLHAYNDSQGHCTACVGHLISMASCSSSEHTYTREQCEQLLAADVGPCENAVKNAIHVPLAQHEVDALISLAFNIGTAGFTSSTLVARINEKADDAAIRDAFLMWRFPPEILGRRQREVELYLNGTYHQ